MLIQYAPYEALYARQTTNNNVESVHEMVCITTQGSSSLYLLLPATQQTLPSEEAIADMYEAANVVRAHLIRCVCCVHLS